MDRLVARRRDADALPGREQAGDEPAARPRLPRAGRPLDEEVAAVEREQEPLQLVEVVRLDRAGMRRAPEHRLERRIAPVAGEQRAPEAHERVLLRLRVVRPAGHERASAAGRPRDFGPRLRTRRRASRSSSVISPALCQVAGSIDVLARRELVLLRRDT